MVFSDPAGQHPVISNTSVFKTCVLLKLNQPQTTWCPPVSDTHAQSQRCWLAAAREDAPEEWWPRGRRGASSIRCGVLLKDSERPAGNRAQFGWTGCFLRWDRGRRRPKCSVTRRGPLSSWASSVPSGPVMPLGRTQRSLIGQPLSDLGRNKVPRYLHSGFYPCPLGLTNCRTSFCFCSLS